MLIERLLGNKKKKPKYDDAKILNCVEKPISKKVGDEYIVLRSTKK